MAEQGAPKYSTAPGNDYAQHEQMYRDFLKLVKWGVISLVVVLLLLWIFLA